MEERSEKRAEPTAQAAIRQEKILPKGTSEPEGAAEATAPPQTRTNMYMEASKSAYGKHRKTCYNTDGTGRCEGCL